ncbi:MAG: hypothetical protein Q9226_003653 [Calogaya cf. arnoldii]
MRPIRRNKQYRADGRDIKVNQLVHQNHFLASLTEIDESPNVRYPELPQDSHDEEGADGNPDTVRRESGQTIKSTGRVSGFSGTTFRTSRSSQELSKEVAEEMTYNLEDLSDASDKILRLLLSNAVSESSIRDMMAKFSDSKSRERKQLERYSSTFQSYRDVYGDGLFIDVPVTVRNMLGLPNQESLQPGPWRVDPVLYKANLTAMVKTLVAQTTDGVDKWIETLDRNFPQPFVQKFVGKPMLEDCADGSALLMEAFSLALDIRTRSFIESTRRLIDAPNFDPDSILQQAFYEDGNMLAGWNVVGLRSPDLLKNQELSSAIINRLDQLRQTFSETESPYIDLDSLDRIFPPSQVLARLSRWCQLRLDEIASQLKRLAGAKGAADALQTVLSRHDRNQLHGISGLDARAIPRPLPDTQALPSSHNVNLSSFNSPKALPVAIGRLKEREAMRRASRNQEHLLKQATTAATATPTTAVRNDLVPASVPALVPTRDAPSLHEPPPWQPGDIDDDEQQPVNEPRQPRTKTDTVSLVEEIIQTQEILDAESNKENVAVQTGPEPAPSFQMNPRREAPIQRKIIPKKIIFDSQEQEPESSNASKSRQLSSQKAQAAAGRSQSDISEDEGFQQDTRPVTKRSTISEKDNNITANGQSPPKRARTGRERREAVEDGDLGGAMQRHNAANAPPAASQVEVYRLANSTAKERVTLRPRRTQTRKPWSLEETERFIELIEEFGLSWTVLKQRDRLHNDGPVLEDRDQVALKDKARNMKMDYLKISRSLPRHFRGVPLKASMVASLSSMGIDYDPDTGMRTDAQLVDDDDEDE